MYLDAAHGGWLGWSNNLSQFLKVVTSLKFDITAIRGFSTNVANYQPVGTMCEWQSTDGITNSYCLNSEHQSDPCCADPCKLESQFNPANNELNYINSISHQIKTFVPDYTPHFIIDTGRNGQTNMRSSCSNWCNVRGAGIGVFPASITPFSDVLDAFFWLKTPGESDGCSEMLPNGSPCPRYDSMCGSVDSIGSINSEPRAPEAGAWFLYQIQQLASNGFEQKVMRPLEKEVQQVIPLTNNDPSNLVHTSNADIVGSILILALIAVFIVSGVAIYKVARNDFSPQYNNSQPLLSNQV